MKWPSRRSLLLNVFFLSVALLIGSQACSKRAEQSPSTGEETPPLASPSIPPPTPPQAASAPPSASVAQAPPAPSASVARPGLFPPQPPRRPGPPGVFNPWQKPLPVASVEPPPAASGEPPAAPAAEKKDPEPVELAIAPKGGVPYHPEGTKFKSPFAKPNAKGQAVKVAAMINSIDDYDIKTGKFVADFYLSMTSEEPMPPIDLHCANGQLENTVKLADRPTFKLYRMSGTFKSPANLRKYPFDSQELKIVLEDDSQGTDQFRLVVDKERTSLTRGFRAVGWRVNYVEARSLSFTYGERFENDDLYYGRYILRVGLERFATGSIFKVYVPALVIVLISLLGMWVPPEEMEVRSNAGAPMLAAAVLFHYSLMQELPATSYLMRADKLMLGVYISLLLGMLSTWAMFLVKEKHVERVFKIARVLVPLLTLTVVVLACVV